MKGKKVGYNDEVTQGMAKDVKDTGQLSGEANERFATGTNSTKRHKSKHKSPGKLGGKGMPD